MYKKKKKINKKLKIKKNGVEYRHVLVVTLVVTKSDLLLYQNTF